MKTVKIGLLGLGTVGGGVYKLIERQKSEMTSKTGADVEIAKILVHNRNKKREGIDESLLTDQWKDIIEDKEIDIVVEVMGGIEPAKTIITEALKAGKNVVTANKDLLAVCGEDLLEIAAVHHVDLMFEAAVAGGIPIMRPLRQCLAGNEITEVTGIVNGTTNYILTKMFELGMSFEEALAKATELGYAEADPTADIEGLDAGRKVAIMATSAFHSKVVFDDVHIEGITKITAQDIKYAKEFDSVIKLIGIARNTESGIEACVYPMLLSSEHPLASSIVEFSKNKKDKDLNVTNYEALDGKGVRGVIDSITYAIGNEKMSDEIDISVKEKINEFAKSGKTPLLVFKENKAVAILAIKDEVKENSKLAISELKKQGIEVIMLTGDNEKTANKIANEVGISKVIANVLPTDKARVIKSLKKDDKHLVAMVGDGVNDALALTTADLGIAIGGGSQIAIESADIVLLRNDLLDCDNAIKLSKRVLNTIKLGLFWAFFYNIICVILSTGIFYYLSNGSFKMQPMYGSIAMSISSVSVVLNALTINLFKVKRNNVDIINNDIKEKENMENKVIINVDGMMCMHCVKHVEDACLKVNGVNDAKASLENKNVTIICDSNTNIDEVKKNITEAGYEVK